MMCELKALLNNEEYRMKALATFGKWFSNILNTLFTVTALLFGITLFLIGSISSFKVADTDVQLKADNGEKSLMDCAAIQRVCATIKPPSEIASHKQALAASPNASTELTQKEFLDDCERKQRFCSLYLPGDSSRQYNNKSL